MTQRKSVFERKALERGDEIITVTFHGKTAKLLNELARITADTPEGVLKTSLEMMQDYIMARLQQERDELSREGKVQ